MIAAAPSPPPARGPAKSEAAFRTISEVAEDLDVPQHVLRFWESRFSQIRPLKRGGGRRYYRPADVALLRRIRDFLYKDGYTIKGVQKLLRESGAKSPLDGEVPSALTGDPAGDVAAAVVTSDSRLDRRALESVLAELMELRALLERSGR